jgi:serine protease Do
LCGAASLAALSHLAEGAETQLVIAAFAPHLWPRPHWRAALQNRRFAMFDAISAPAAALSARHSAHPAGRARAAAWALGLGLVAALLAAPPARALGAPDSFADLAQQVSPSVVNITTSSIVATPTGNGPMVPEGSPFEEFFREFMDPDGPGRRGDGGGDGGGGDDSPRRSEALGSGFVISEDGFIVTNNHVIEGADQINIEFFDGKRLEAKLVGTDPKTDIAVLKVEGEDLPFVEFGDSDQMRVGDWVMAMGNPLGQGFSVSAGIISARGRELSGTYDDFLQTDAAINKGNSGGPLFNLDGQVVGVNTAILSPSGGSIGIGFSMASNVVSKVVDQLREFGETRRGWLGVKIQNVTPELAESMGLSISAGALITDVPEGPARDAGLEAGDVIVSFDGQDIADVRDLTRTVADSPFGQEVTVGILRDGKTMEMPVTLGRREEAEAASARPAKGKENADEPAEPAEVLGLMVQPMTDELAKSLNLAPGSTGLVVVEVDAASDAGAKGLAAGDVIVEAGQQKVANVGDLQARVEAARDEGRKSILLLIRREGNPRFVALAVN